MKKNISALVLILIFLACGKFSAFSENSPDECEVFIVELFGQVLTSEQEKIEFINVNIGEEGVEQIREVLPRLSSCRYLLLDNCGISDETMAKLRDDFPNIKVVWRVGFEGFPLTFLTDSTVVHVAVEIGGKIIYDWNSSVLNYCTDVEYLDLGHGVLTNIDFCSHMPHLKYLIMSYNPVSDLSPLKNCPELEFAEFYFCTQLRDISPLAECRNLKYLNVSATGVDDISPVYGLEKLERFFCIMNDYHVTTEQKEEISDYLPDCWITFEKPVSINVGWSYDEPNVRADWYLKIRDIWRYLTEPWYVGYVD